MRRIGRGLGASAPPIAIQILGLLIGGLVAAQLATLALSVLAPPSVPEYRLDDIARALRGGALRGEGLPPLERGTEARPPDPRSPGWLTSQGPEAELARLLGVDLSRVRLLFYSPPPFAGSETRRSEAERYGPHVVEANLLGPLLMAPPPGGPPGGPGAGGPGGGGSGGWGGPGGGGPGGWNGPGGGRQGGGARGGSGPGGPGAGGPGRGQGGGMPGGAGQHFDPPLAPVVQGAPDAPSRGGQRGTQGSGGLGSGGLGPTGAGAGPGGNGQGPIATAPRGGLSGGGPVSGAPGGVLSPLFRPTSPLDPSVAGQEAVPVQAFDPVVRPPRPAPAAAVASDARPATAISAPAASDAAAPSAILAAPTRHGRVAPLTQAAAQTLAPPLRHSLFGMARAPVVDGEFLAALQVSPTRWVTVRPRQDPVLSAWQRRLALWFLLSFAAVAPLGYLLARRLAAPLGELADAADRLGRDPAAAIGAGGGAPEIRRLAEALLGMQARLRRHVEDRTAMVGAISHDLRTPLARLRFKLERAPPALKASMLRDMTQMEEMLNAVLIFIRDASEPATRQMVDLRSIVECVVDDAALVGDDATLEPGGPAAVEVDISAIQRVVTNLVENAIKYGGCAHVRLHAEAGEAVVAVADAGEGLPDSELETVFKPFYRSEGGRRITGSGIGLGLSTSRSLARAHGGDVVLRNTADGLVAELRLPLALGLAAPTRDTDGQVRQAARAA